MHRAIPSNTYSIYKLNPNPYFKIPENMYMFLV